MARGRRVNSSGEKSKQLLLEKAIELFSTHGYHQTKISDIVKAANLTQPTFYLYFQSKESLFKDLNTEFQTRLYETFDYGLKHAACVRTELFENLKRVFAYFVQNPHLTKIGFYASEDAEDVKNNLVKRIIKIVEVKQDHHVDAQTLAESIVGSIERLTLTNLLTYEKEPEKLAEDIVNIYFVKQAELV
ncbi:TetR/AcrR family transcriptional regulator [Lysinibacillus sp. LZ02]|uniref:TetR/AcrR family transcriptional regulator n=1 Tax=Lysinibacillus sp. LZ02 TaxID=3420668 RepID=UPI003D368A45